MPPLSDSVRRPAVAGMFYPGSQRELGDDVDVLLAEAAIPSGVERPIALVAPHAGYVYSGPTAAAAYALLRDQQFQTVVVVSPSHREYFPGVSVYPGSGYETPLGVIPLAAGIRERLLDASHIVKSSKAGHATEHAVEVHLPFLQKVLGVFHLLPLVMGEQSRATCFALGEALGTVLKNESALLVASTDLSHFHPAAEAERRDRVVLQDLKAFDPEVLMDDLEAEKAEACGGGPVVAVMVAARALGARQLRVLGHTHSGKITGDTHSVVGYCSAVMTA
jgi:MEMO1 family protein